MLVEIHGRAGILKKRVLLERRFFFKFGGWIGSISSCFALTPDIQKYVGRSTNGGRMVENWKADFGE